MTDIKGNYIEDIKYILTASELLSLTHSKIEPSPKQIAQTIQTRLFPEIKDNVSTYPHMEDFLPKGKFAHVFIPQYVYVPQWILKHKIGTTNIRTKDEYVLWY